MLHRRVTSTASTPSLASRNQELALGRLRRRDGGPPEPLRRARLLGRRRRGCEDSRGRSRERSCVSAARSRHCRYLCSSCHVAPSDAGPKQQGFLPDFRQLLHGDIVVDPDFPTVRQNLKFVNSLSSISSNNREDRSPVSLGDGGGMKKERVGCNSCLQCSVARPLYQVLQGRVAVHHERLGRLALPSHLGWKCWLRQRSVCRKDENAPPSAQVAQFASTRTACPCSTSLLPGPFTACGRPSPKLSARHLSQM